MWEAARTFSECEAWLDLIQSARFEATVTIERIGGREIKVGRGQYPASNRYLARKWCWGEQKVKGFLGRLKAEGMIVTDKSQGMNVITLCKYDAYNASDCCIPDDIPTDDSGIDLIIKELSDIRTHLETQGITHRQPTDNPNFKKVKKEEEIFISTPYNPPREYKSFDFNFLDAELSEHFFRWLNYKTSKKQMYRSQKSIELCYSQLLMKSKGCIKTSAAIIEQSIANNWNGLFELKEQKHANSNKFKTSDRQQPDYTIGM